MRARYPALPILMLTGFAQELPAGIHDLVDGVITKGTAPGEVLQQLRCVLGRAPEKPAAASQIARERVAGHVRDVRKQVQRSRELGAQLRGRKPRKPS